MVSGLVRLRIWLGRGFHTTSAAHTPRSCTTLIPCPGKATPSTGPAAVAEAAAASRPIGCALVVCPPCTASVKFGSLTITGTLWSPSDRGAWMALVCSRKAEARRPRRPPMASRGGVRTRADRGRPHHRRGALRVPAWRRRVALVRAARARGRPALGRSRVSITRAPRVAVPAAEQVGVRAILFPQPWNPSAPSITEILASL